MLIQRRLSNIRSRRTANGLRVAVLKANNALTNKEIARALNRAVKEKKIDAETMSIDKIKEIVERLTKITPGSIDIKTRKRVIVEARQISMVMSKLLTKHSLAKIGEEHGGKDHATVIHAVKTVGSLYYSDRIFREKVNPIIEELKCETKFERLYE